MSTKASDQLPTWYPLFEMVPNFLAKEITRLIILKSTNPTYLVDYVGQTNRASEQPSKFYYTIKKSIEVNYNKIFCKMLISESR